MSRRSFGATLVATGLVAGVGGVLLSSASAAACTTYDDPPNDQKMQLTSSNSVSDADGDLDIIGLTYTSTPEELHAVISVRDLKAMPDRAPGHGYTILYTLNGARFRHSYYKYGAGPLDSAAEVAEIQQYNTKNGTAIDMTFTATWDVTANRVTFKIKRADLDTHAGEATAGKSLSLMTAQNNSDYVADGFTYDTLAAPAEATYKIGDACTVPTPGGSASPSAAPTATATPSASPSATPSPSPTQPGGVPAGYPKADCNTIDDVKGDGNPTPVANGPGTGNDRDLDIIGVVFQTTATELKAFVRIDRLTMPAQGFGHRFEVAFTANSKPVVLIAAEVNAAAAAYPLSTYPYGTVSGTTNAAAKPTVVFDKTNHVVVFSIERAKLAEAVAGDVGDELTGVSSTSKLIWTPTHGTITADTAQAPAVADRVYRLGDNKCFEPPAGVLSAISATRVQYGDVSTVSAKLATATGTVLPGKTVRFTVGSNRVDAVTDAQGIARKTLRITSVTAGTRPMTVSFAGDSSAKAVTAPGSIVVTTEVTRSALSVARSGTRRTVTVTLTDDDRAAVAGQTVTWYVNGRKVATSRTSSAGKASYAGAKGGQTVKAVYAGLSGKYRGSSAQVRA